MDGAGNLIDKKRVVEVLENESDYERGMGKLNTKQEAFAKALVTIEELLNPIDESINMDKATDDDIFNAVMNFQGTA